MALMARTPTAALPMIGTGRRFGWWGERIGRLGSDRHGQLERLRPARSQGPRPATDRRHSAPLVTVVYRG
jgi:hypothetical protein